jgi:hypothetical protein
MSTSEITRTGQSFDPEALRGSIEERGATTLLGLYAEDAELQVVDRNDQPSNAKAIRGRRAHRPYRVSSPRPPDCDDTTMAPVAGLATARRGRHNFLGGLIHQYERAA